MVNTKAIRTALYNKLNVASVINLLGSGSASLVHGIAPSDRAHPLCVFHKQSGVATKTFGTNAFDSQLWLIKAVVRDSSSSAAEDIAKAVDNLLDFGTLTITGGTLMYLARESDVDYVEVIDGQQYRHHGATYRLVVR